MRCTQITENIVKIERDENDPAFVMTDVQSALDLLMSVQYECQCNCILMDKSLIIEDFFDLSTKLAGEILQKFMTYDVKIAVIGDFTGYQSRSLKDFIFESNRGNHFFFVATEQEGIERLCGI